MDAANCETISGSVNPVTFEAQRQARPRAPVRGSTLGRIVLLYLPDSNSFRQVDPLRVERDRGFADSLLEESGFEPLVPLQSQHNRGTGPMSPTASIRVALLI